MTWRLPLLTALAVLGLILSGCGSTHHASPPVVHKVWPPKSSADAQALASEWHGPDLKVIRLKRAFTGCWCNVAVLVPHRLSARREAEALLDVFYDRGLNKKGDVSVSGYLSRKDMTMQGKEGGSYDAGQVSLDEVEGSHSFELDTGDGFSAKDIHCLPKC